MGFMANLRTANSLFFNPNWIQIRTIFMWVPDYYRYWAHWFYHFSPFSLSLKTFPDASRPHSRPPAKLPNHSPIPRSPSSRLRSRNLRECWTWSPPMSPTFSTSLSRRSSMTWIASLPWCLGWERSVLSWLCKGSSTCMVTWWAGLSMLKS